MLQPKNIEYAVNPGSSKGKVLYVKDGNNVYFIGLSASATSSINAAEQIATAISQEEDLPVEKLRFIDVQTHRSYPEAYAKGRYSVSRVSFEQKDGQLRATNWGPSMEDLNALKEDSARGMKAEVFAILRPYIVE